MPQDATDALKTATGLQKKPRTYQQAIEEYKPQLARALPKFMNADRFVRIALTAFSKDEKLAQCTIESVYAAIITGAQLGLEPGVMGQGYLIPYKQKNGTFLCQFIPGWQGYIDLVSRSGRASLWTGVRREGEKWKYRLGSNPRLFHEPNYDLDETKGFMAAYACGKVTGAPVPVIDVWGLDRIFRHRTKQNKVGDSHYSMQGPHNFEMYARKLPLLQVIKYMPKSVQLQQALNADDAGSNGVQPHTIDAALIPIADKAPFVVPKEYAEIVNEILGWSNSTAERWFKDHEGDSEEKIKSLLSDEVEADDVRKGR